MARKKTEPSVEEPLAEKPVREKAKKSSGSLLGALFGVVLVFGAFFFGAQYFTAKRSTSATVCATSLGTEFLTAYRLPSGALDRFAPEDLSSPTIQIPMASQFTIVNAEGKRVKAGSYVLDAASPKIVKLTINPQDAICKIEELPNPFKVQGSATVKGKREIAIGKDSYFIGGTLMLSAGNLTANPGGDLEGAVNTGDVVTLVGQGDEVAVLDIHERAGTVSVSSNVEGARVYVDGALRGKTPCVLTASPGERLVLVRADGYSEKRFPVLVSSQDETEVEADLALVTGTVSVSATPPGATVTVGGEIMGKAPAKIPLKPGNYEIKVELAGYYPRKTQVLVVKDVDQPLDFTLVKKPGTTGDEPDDGQSGGSGDFKYIETGVVLMRNGASLFIGDRWTECLLQSDAVAMDDRGYIPLGQIEPGDTVTVYGDSPSAVRLVKLDKALADKWPFEGFLVRTATGYKVFGDSSTLLITIPDDLYVVDPANRKKEAVGAVTSGSRLKFYVDGKGQAVWAEYVWPAGASVEGTVGSLSGAVFRVAPSWEDLYLSTETIVFVDTRRSDFYDLRVGDIAIAAGPHSRDIRFIWVKSRPGSTTEVQAVTISTGGKTGKTLQEYRGFTLQGYTLQAGSDVSLFHPAEKATISASQLQYGDRVRVWLDDNRRIAFGEVLLMEDFRITGIFLGEEEGFYYFSGFNRFVPAADLILTGLAPGEDLQPGSKVLAAGRAGSVNYIEVQSEVTSSTVVTGTVLGTKDFINLRKDTGGVAAYTYAKDTWFADWVQRQDGLVSSLFPGDKVSLYLGSMMNIVWAERSYAPPFKLEGTIEYISAQERTIVISDKTSRKTITLWDSVTIMKDGDSSGIYGLALGDKVRVSGRDKAHVDMVVVGQ